MGDNTKPGVPSFDGGGDWMEHLRSILPSLGNSALRPTMQGPSGILTPANPGLRSGGGGPFQAPGVAPSPGNQLQSVGDGTGGGASDIVKNLVLNSKLSQIQAAGGGGLG